jgi:uncharacterized protein (TIGR02118 family)
MVRFMALYDTPDDPQAFDKHYFEVHIPLAKQLPGLVRYTVSRNIAPVRGGPRYYIIAELDFDSMEAMRAAFASEIGKQTGADVPKFAPGDKSHSVVFEVAEV